MKKIIMTAALAIASFGAFAATEATNNLNVRVPQILSVVANPANQTLILATTDLNGGNKEFALPTTWTIRSNAKYNVDVTVSADLAPISTTIVAGNPEYTSSMNAFKSALQLQISSAESSVGTSVPTSWYTLDQVMSAPISPLGQTGMARTDYNGHEFGVKAKIENAGMTMIPGTYTATIKVTVSQP